MRNLSIISAAAALVVGAGFVSADPSPILAPGNPIIAFDSDLPQAVGSSYPTPAETPPMVIDGLLTTKYLNFGGEGSGFIVIPSAASTVQSFQLSTANDTEGRDPKSFQLFGTNSPIVSADNSNGQGEPWSLISSGSLTLPSTRTTAGPIVDVSNSTSYSAYKLLFPTLKQPGVGAMQISEAQFFGGPAGTGGAILAPSNNIRAVDDPAFTSGVSQSNYPNAAPNIEGPVQGIDQNTGTKYLNFGREHSGLIVTPSIHAIVDGIQFTTANDTPSRDPSLITIYGTNDPITDPDNGFGSGENWTVIVANLPYASPDTRTTLGPLVSFPNGTAWNSYKIEVVDNKGPDTGTGSANSIQFAEVQLFSGSVPEPSTMLMAIGGAVAFVARRRR